MDFDRSREMQARLREIVPGGCHTYAKGDDQYPELAPGVIARGLGCHVWDVDGNEFVEYGMGLRAVTLGHAYPPVVDAVRESLALGTNFSRPVWARASLTAAVTAVEPSLVNFTISAPSIARRNASAHSSSIAAGREKLVPSASDSRTASTTGG